jgi:hypothetical protein
MYGDVVNERNGDGPYYGRTSLEIWKGFEELMKILLIDVCVYSSD